MPKVAVLVGSLRKESINLAYARALMKLGASRFDFDLVEIGDLPLYNEDLWATPPEAVLRFKQHIDAADAVLFITPEYNRSTTPAMKNAIDWGSRPWGQSSWAGKPATITGATGGAIGTAIAQSHLRAITTSILDMIVMGAPEVYLTVKPDTFDANGDITNDQTREFLDGYLDKFAAFVAKQAG
jgi:chromate reductase